MTVQFKEVPYEILIRLSRSGEVSGMHYRKLALVVDAETSEVLSATELGPFPVSSEGEGGFTYSSVLGEALSAMSLSVATLNTEVARLLEENAALKLHQDMSKQPSDPILN